MGLQDVGGDGTDCPNSPETGSRKCTRCSIADATFASDLHHAHTRERGAIDPDVAAHLGQPNVLYLAVFRDGSLKVGTSTASRKATRLIEQGAWMAREVADAADGFAVRAIEDRVTRELDIPQSVSSTRKLDGLVGPVPDAILESRLQIESDRVAELLTRMDDERLASAARAWRNPMADLDVWSHVHRYPLDLTSGTHDLEVVAACGRIVAMVRPERSDVFVADLQPLFGVELEVGDYESDELAVQDSLF